MRIGLRQRYALIIALSAVAVASAVQVVSYWESKRLAEEVERSSSQSMSQALKREADLAARQLASVLKDSLVEPLAEEDFERIFNITHSARSLPDVKQVLVYDHDGRVIHDGTKEIASYGARAPDGLRTLVLEQGQTLTKFDETTLDVCAPIRTETRVLGAIRFSVSLARFVEHGMQLNQELAAINQESADKHLRNFVGLIVPLFLLGTAVGIFFAGRLIEPIQGLMAMTRRIAQRDFAVDVSEHRSDEFGELASSLRHMAAEIEESMISRSLLEKKVQERTLALQEANRQLEQRDHHRRRFLAEASHELRTPLTIIHGEAQVTARQKHDDVAHYQECLTTITEQTTAMRRLVDDLLKLARLDHHLTEYSFERIQVADIIQSTEKAARKLTKPKDLQIISECKQADITIFGDRQKLRQLMMIFIKEFNQLFSERQYHRDPWPGPGRGRRNPGLG